MICPGCGTDNLAGKMLCYKCGVNLLQAPGAVPQEGKKAGRKKAGWKGCLTGCLVVILIVIGASVVLWITSREKVMEWAVLSVISEEVDKEEVKEVIARVREAWEKGEFDAEKLEKANRKLREYITDAKLDKEEVDKLMEMFREAIGVEEEIAPVPKEVDKLMEMFRGAIEEAEEREERRRMRVEGEANAWLQIGDNFVRLGMYDLALEFYQKVIDRHPESEYAPRAQKLMEEIKARREPKK